MNTYRSTAIRFAGWAWIVFVAANLVDIAWRGRDRTSLVSGAVLLIGCGVAYVIALRPRIVADEDGVRLHNLLRDVRIPWAAVEKIEGGDAVYLHVGDRRFRAYVLQTSPRARVKAERRAHREEGNLPEAVADYVRHRTVTDFTVEQLRERHTRVKADGPAEVTVTWSWPAFVALGVPVVLLVVVLVA